MPVLRLGWSHLLDIESRLQPRKVAPLMRDVDVTKTVRVVSGVKYLGWTFPPTKWCFCAGSPHSNDFYGWGNLISNLNKLGISSVKGLWEKDDSVFNPRTQCHDWKKKLDQNNNGWDEQCWAILRCLRMFVPVIGCFWSGEAYLEK